MSDYYVVKAAACAFHPTPCIRSVFPYCNGCLGDGLRVSHESAIKVEPASVVVSDSFFTMGEREAIWRAAPTREDNNQ